MLKHEKFEEFCALAATGQLSPDEQRQLNEHVDGCQACRAAYEEFSLVLRELPATEHSPVDPAVLRHVDERESRERFLARARAEGRRFSEEAQEGHAARRWKFPRVPVGFQWAATGALLTLLVVSVGYLAIRKDSGSPRVGAVQTTNTPANPVRAEDGSRNLSAEFSELQSSNEASQKTISQLKAENALLRIRFETLEKRLGETEAGKQALDQQVARANEIDSQLASQMEQNTQVLTQSKAELEKARADRAATEAEVGAQKAEISDLSQQVRLQATNLDRDRQLLLAGRDITDLMGARSLHIIDVHDADGSGKNRRSFGRVFYTEGKSLIFYAFDLDEKKVANAKFTFEAWGERLGQPATVKSLGVLYSDDKEQRRWVLKVDDPQQLAEIDSVFVTLEPHDGGTDRPRGKKILYAFLSGKPNHP